MTTLLTFENVTKTYDQPERQLTILDDIDLSINSAETVAIVGPSGSGKSTFLNLAGALDTPTSGSVKLDGNDLSELNDKKLSQLRLQKIGFVFQQHNLLPQCTAFENILMPTLPLGSSKKHQKKAMELLEAVGLEERAHHMPSALSGGECQRVALARALINSPQIIFADEPTGSLDNRSADSITDLLLTLNERYNTTLVVVTHSDNVAERMQRTLRLHNGKLV